MNVDVANTDEQNDPYSEMSQDGYTTYKYSWNTAQPIKLVDRN